MNINYERLPSMVSRQTFMIFDGLDWIGEIRVSKEDADEAEKQMSKMWSKRSAATVCRRPDSVGAAVDGERIHQDAGRV